MVCSSGHGDVKAMTRPSNPRFFCALEPTPTAAVLLALPQDTARWLADEAARREKRVSVFASDYIEPTSGSGDKIGGPSKLREPLR